MLIAVASKSGTLVDQHFGHAERFLIYDCAGGKPQLVDQKPVEKYCSFDPDHPFREDKFSAILAALAGCRAVVSAQIGELPRQELEKRGISAISAVGPIDQAILAAHGTLCGCGGGCGPNNC
ncbi:Predicted Fe-Mo cluster-binding protein, NifX family [Geoalkalibacter ferrihydriticus]|uniref:Dinitrogenase iron-molybdenum cofactor biosynthesis protein n=2 Tax=Geoalkalibacter ferrihydriticus TaxID=392333 RepID=A0A0C2HTG3_9BACT|nr:NifB/NifX family molybdenum-iron cluster-binding protein [Geoalkalibacter ferrihydriticus]KIH76117.1 dinitrogenase iron-molybdenum cofactor biosynthesis protein [Geoalkalibacter ferrihydriticus DSM 17813]SDM44554.1 Predicted Fe-Mo cluster-binding protein, NifX family [Geoalkalibacter ferrihydriticus]